MAERRLKAQANNSEILLEHQTDRGVDGDMTLFLFFQEWRLFVVDLTDVATQAAASCVRRALRKRLESREFSELALKKKS